MTGTWKGEVMTGQVIKDGVMTGTGKDDGVMTGTGKRWDHDWDGRSGVMSGTVGGVMTGTGKGGS